MNPGGPGGLQDFEQWKQFLESQEGGQSGMFEAVQNDPTIAMFQRAAQDILADPDFMEMAKELQGGMMGAGGAPDYSKYMETMSKMFTNDKYMKKAEQLGQTILNSNPEMKNVFQGMMGQMQDPAYQEKIADAMQGIKDDKRFRPFVEQMEKNNPMEAMKFLQEHPELMGKYNEVLKSAFDISALGLEPPAAGSRAIGADAEAPGEEVDLHTAASEGNPAVVKQLLASGANVNEKDDEGRTALHFACGYGELECAKALLDAGGNTNLVDNNGNTALHYAAGYGQLEGVKLLLRKGVDLTLKNNDGNIALEVAKLNEHTAVVEMLEKAAIKPKGLGGKGLN